MSTLRIDYGPEVEAAIDEVADALRQVPELADPYPVRWLAILLVDDDPGAGEILDSMPGGEAIEATVRRARARLEAGLGRQALTAVAGARYEWIHDLVAEAVTHARPSGPTPSDRIDALLTNRWLGIPFFLAAMWMVFKVTTDVAGVFLDWIDEAVSGPVANLVNRGLTGVGLGGSWLRSLLVDGVLAGVGAVLTFVPILVALYIALAFLEDTGYMARAAFVMDRVMGGVGLPGKSFLPMLVGFGCTVPAIYATRTLEDRRDRVLTGLLVPFMSCGARLPVYVLVAAAFFPHAAGTAVFLMYLLGILVALVIGAILRRTVLPVERSTPAILELPPYRLPTLRSIRRLTWQRTRAFLGDAGSIILGTSVVVWLLMAIPVGGGGEFGDTAVKDSAFATGAGLVAPAFEPLGFGSWEATGSLMTGFVAKEVVIATMGQVYGLDEPAPVDETTLAEDVGALAAGFGRAVVDTLRAIPGAIGLDAGGSAEEEPPTGLVGRIRTEFETTSGGHGAAAAVAFMVFVLLYTPCMAAVAAARKELGTGWMWASVIGQTALAWTMGFMAFQIGKAVGL
ncbi:MAG: ferrous iron transport protein B [Acidimicrobiia bacterium]